MKKEGMKLVKKLTAGLLAAGMLVTGCMYTSKPVTAAVAEDEVIYESVDNIGAYWKTSEKKAPVKAGYVFGGWYKKVDTSYVALRSSDLNTDEDVDCDYTGEAYAKFVPAQVLSVKAQNSENMSTEDGAGAISGDNAGHIRVLSSLDSLDYQKVGFEIRLANTGADKGGETTKVYSGIQVGSSNVQANAVFGGVSQYLSVWQLDKIDTPSNCNKIIYVRPYWVTLDGTTVKGLAKYVHIEDCYKNYVSVPVNILNEDAVAQMAAGAVNMTYSNDGFKFVEVEAGRILPEMESNQSGTTIKMVGNAAYNEYNAGETLYANVRFEKPASGSATFENTMVQFCDWNEELVTVTEKWDIKY